MTFYGATTTWLSQNTSGRLWLRREHQGSRGVLTFLDRLSTFLLLFSRGWKNSTLRLLFATL
jgi:hypothetical protein